jgi:hypothetical protein
VRCLPIRQVKQDARRGPTSTRGFDAEYHRNRKLVLGHPGAYCRRCGTTENLTVDRDMLAAVAASAGWRTSPTRNRSSTSLACIASAVVADMFVSDEYAPCM